MPNTILYMKEPGTFYSLLLLLVALSTSGCPDHIYEKADLTTNTSVVTDAKQRIITNTSLDLNHQKSLLSRGRITPSRIVCAEPSPDVAQAISQALSTSLAASLPKGPATITIQGNLNYGMSESVAQLGERLGTIQLLRDKMYRACEAYSNGAISATTYTIIMSRLDKTMATLMLGEMSAGAFGRGLAALGGASKIYAGEIGSGATATATVSGGPINGINVTSGGSGYTTPPTVTIEGGGGSGAAATAAINPGIVSEIKLTKSGTGYTSVPTVTVEGGGGVGALAAATVTTGTIQEIKIGNGGTGYTSPPVVTIEGGGGSGAAATATVIAGIVTDIKVTKGGSGYSSAPAIKIEGGAGNGATATAAAPTGVVSEIKIIKGGTGYTSTPTVKIEGGAGNGATATAAVTTGVLSEIKIIKGGTGYTSTPTVKLDGGGGSGATASAIFVNGVISEVKVINAGSGYTTTPKVNFEGGGGTGATANATVKDGAVSAIKVINSGSGYINSPAVVFSSSTNSGGGVFSSTGVDQSDSIGSILGRTGSPTDAVVRQMTLMQKQYLDKDDLGTLLDACITATDLLDEPSEAKLEKAQKGVKDFNLASSNFVTESMKEGINSNPLALKQLKEQKEQKEQDLSDALAEIRISPLGTYCKKDALPKVIQVFAERESVAKEKVQLCKSIMEESKSDATWKNEAQMCASNLLK